MRKLVVSVLVLAVVDLVLIAVAIVQWVQPKYDVPVAQKREVPAEQEKPARATDVAKTIAALKAILARRGETPAKPVEPKIRRNRDPVLRRIRLFEPSWEEPASQKPEEALAILKAALKNPPDDGAGKEEVCYAQIALSDSTSHEVTRVMTHLVEDEKQDPKVRAMLFVGIERLPYVDINRLRAFCTKMLNDRSSHLWLRVSAARMLGAKRVATDVTRALLEKTLFATDEMHSVQSACLDALSETAPLDHLRGLLSREDLRGHPSFMVRARVCAGLATFRVRTRSALEFLCRLVEEIDPKDEAFLVPQEAILSFWILTGRAPGVDAEREALFANVPAPYQDAADLRQKMWYIASVRKGVSEAMFDAVQDVTCKNSKSARAAWKPYKKPTWIRNDEGLKAAVEFARKELDAIEAEWRALSDGGDD